MLNDIKKFFEEKLLIETRDTPDAALGIEYATAALMIELAKADFEGEHLEELMAAADEASSEASDFFQFTSLINEHYDNTQKIALLENLWRVAFADGRLDKYEEQFIRRIAGLINLPPSEFTKTKLRIKHQLMG